MSSGRMIQPDCEKCEHGNSEYAGCGECLSNIDKHDYKNFEPNDQQIEQDPVYYQWHSHLEDIFDMGGSR